MRKNNTTQIRWINCLHIYQPPWQKDEIVHTVTRESYLWIIEKLLQFPDLRLTLNIAGTLLETFDRLGYQPLIRNIQKCLDAGQIELTGSSQFHAFLPELPESEIVRQIELQEQTLARCFNGYKPKGFFPPELAYHPRIGSIVAAKGYSWILLDPMASTTIPEAQVRYEDSLTGLAVIFRDRTLSKTYPPETLFKRSQKRSAKNETVITATDGELYGHFHKDWQDHLKQIMERKAVQTETMSGYLARCQRTEKIKLRPASWETRSKQLRGNNPFSIWYNRVNPIHRELWKIAHLAIALVSKHTDDPNHTWARYHLDRGLASCSWWWASEIKTSPFAPLAWNPDEVERGALELIKAIRSLEKLPPEKKISAERLYSKLLETVWTTHWQRYGK